MIATMIRLPAMMGVTFPTHCIPFSVVISIVQ
jgi:hypothetical protein